MILKIKNILTDKDIEVVNSIAVSISMTISSQASRSVNADIAINNLMKVQRLGSEIGINNLPTSAQQLKHKVIKVCTSCKKIELTSKYNFKHSFEKHDDILCRKCAQNTLSEKNRRSLSQKRLMSNTEYRKSVTLKIIEYAKSELNSKNIKKAHLNGKYDNKDWSFLNSMDYRILRHCIAKNIPVSEFKGFVPKKYPREYSKIRKSILQRDNNECQLCGLKQAFSKKPLHVHHKDGNKMNNSQNNLITLCESCHIECHRDENVNKLVI